MHPFQAYILQQMGYTLWASNSSAFLPYTPELSDESADAEVPRLILVGEPMPPEFKPLLNAVMQTLGVGSDALCYVTPERALASWVKADDLYWFVGCPIPPHAVDGRFLQSPAFATLRVDWLAKRDLWRQIRSLDV